LSRTVEIKAKDLKEFLKPFREAAESGKEYIEPTFFATTALKRKFSMLSNVEFIVKPKENGSGRTVDQYKNTMFEGEVLYPPFSKFKVTKIEEEDLPSREEIKEGDKFPKALFSDQSKFEEAIVALKEAYMLSTPESIKANKISDGEKADMVRLRIINNPTPFDTNDRCGGLTVQISGCTDKSFLKFLCVLEWLSLARQVLEFDRKFV
jgi:hypothetical protein